MPRDLAPLVENITRVLEALAPDVQRLLDYMPAGHDPREARVRISQLATQVAPGDISSFDEYGLVLGSVARSLVFREDRVDLLPPLAIGTDTGGSLLIRPADWHGRGTLVLQANGTMSVAADARAQTLDWLHVDSVELARLGYSTNSPRVLDLGRPTMLQLIADTRLRHPWQSNERLQDQLLGCIRIASQLKDDPAVDLLPLQSWLGQSLRRPLPPASCVVELLHESGCAEPQPAAPARYESLHLAVRSAIEQESRRSGSATLHVRLRDCRFDQFAGRISVLARELEGALAAEVGEDPCSIRLRAGPPEIARHGILVDVSSAVERVPYAQLRVQWDESATEVPRRAQARLRHLLPGARALTVHVTLENRAHARAFVPGLLADVGTAPSPLRGFDAHLFGYSRRVPSEATCAECEDRIRQARAADDARWNAVAAHVDNETRRCIASSFERDLANLEDYLVRMRRDRPIAYGRSVGTVVVAFLVWSSVISVTADLGGLAWNWATAYRAAVALVPALVAGGLIWRLRARSRATGERPVSRDASGAPDLQAPKP